MTKDEAIKRIKSLNLNSKDMEALSTLVLEIVESEDEKIRKIISDILLIDSDEIRKILDVNNVLMQDIDAWLKKQGEEKSNPYSGVSFAYNGHTWGMCARDNGVEILIDGHIKGRVFANDSNAKEMFIKALERVEEENNKGYKLTDCDKNSWWEDFKAYASCTVEHKPTDKVEPEFHEGEWLINLEHGNVVRVLDVLEDNYRLDYGGDTIGLLYTELVDNDYRLWTINDAKDGDILANKYGAIFINASSSKVGGTLDCYCYLSVQNKFCIEKHKTGSWFYKDEIKPATKEQCDLLFQKMKEAGYEWDADKKELKKIEQNLDWSEEDERMYRGLHNLIYSTPYCDSRKELSDWLKSLKDRVQPQQQEWSEEDEEALEVAIIALEDMYSEDSPLDCYAGHHMPFDKAANQLKYLKERYAWKPSDEQMDALDYYANSLCTYCDRQDDLRSLFNVLKKLREE